MFLVPLDELGDEEELAQYCARRITREEFLSSEEKLGDMLVLNGLSKVFICS